MDLFKKLIIVLALGALLHIQFPHTGFADAKQGKVTKNKPQFATSAEEFLPGAGSATATGTGTTTGKLSKKSLIWIAAGAAVVVLALVASGGGGGGSGGDDPPNNDPGGVEVEW